VNSCHLSSPLHGFAAYPYILTPHPPHVHKKYI
jgi:hypothetical protein